MTQGFLSIILHAHLPYVHHPEYESFFEETWLFEAISECYIPLLGVLERLQQDNVNYRLTISLSPTLITMLRDETLQERYIKHLLQLLELSEKEILRTRKQPKYQKLARLYRRFFNEALKTYRDDYQCDLISAFKQHHAAGHLELITCAATHGFLPALSLSEIAVRNQIRLGIETFKAALGFSPIGFWLPECGYYPGLEDELKDAGIQYFFTDTHGVMYANRRPVNGVYAPLDCGNGVTAFARDPLSSRQVWSAEEGYPGDFDYREYYSDIGFELDLETIGPYLPAGNHRVNTGIKYHRVTGGNQPKEIYQPRNAAEKAALQAKDFIDKTSHNIDLFSTDMDRPPIIVAPFDAELFGHWWFEGPQWLEQLLRLADNKNNNLQTISCRDYLNKTGNHQVAQPSASTWGEHGYSEYWINEKNAWIYPFLHKAGANMEKLAYDFKDKKLDPIQERALNQAARSLLLAQASDWPFIMKSGTTIEYAKKRFFDFLARFNYLEDSLRNDNINERYLLALEEMDNIFPDIDFRNYSPDNEHIS